jgi:signal transduction histidine kinase
LAPKSSKMIASTMIRWEGDARPANIGVDLCFVCVSPVVCVMLVISLTILGDKLDQRLLEGRERLFCRLLLLGTRL